MTDSMKKIRLKRAPKIYKSQPRLEGRARLQQRLLNLMVDVQAFEKKATNADDIRWAEGVYPLLEACARVPVRRFEDEMEALRVFNRAVQEFRRG